jgi:release factor glutamine methyltransferase
MNELLLELGKNLYLEMNEELDENTLAKFNSIMDKLCQDMPLAYAMGVQYFYGYPIEVNSDVLIPRFETEELVLKVIQEIDEHFENEEITVLDVGTGSGAIACALKAECPQIHMFASDISEDALKQAQRNADNNKVKIDIITVRENPDEVKVNKADISILDQATGGQTTQTRGNQTQSRGAVREPQKTTNKGNIR